MTPQQIAVRADAARADFDAWVRAQLAEDATLDPHALVTRSIAHFRRDPDFMGGWFAASFLDRIAAHLAHREGSFDLAPRPTHAGAGTHRAGPAKRAKAPPGWQAWLATEKVPRRTKLLRRADLAEIVAAERQAVEVHATNARLAETLLSRMPETQPDLRVGEVWTDDELAEAVRASLAPAPLAAIPDATERKEALP